ncbi:hypothetical protein NAS91_004205 [Escherichia coli]|nr:hypothetical protein [Escherichia coli]
MGDWRSNPRDGYFRFKEYKNEIIEMKNKGATNRKIFEFLSKKGLALSESQFNRYMRGTFSSRRNKIKEQDVLKIDNIPMNSNETTISQQSVSWNNINVSNSNLINDLVRYGYTPEIVKSWDLPNEIAIRRRLVSLTAKKGKI